MPTYRLSPSDLANLPTDARRVVAEALAAHLGAPVDVGGTRAGPVAAAPDVPKPPQRRRLRHPWVMGGLAVAMGLGLVVLCAWAWLAWPRAGIPASSLDGPVVSATAPQTLPATRTIAAHAATTPAQVLAQPVGTSSTGGGTAPAQVLAAPSAQGATVCAVLRGGILGACHWQGAG